MSGTILMANPEQQKTHKAENPMLHFFLPASHIHCLEGAREDTAAG